MLPNEERPVVEDTEMVALRHAHSRFQFLQELLSSDPLYQQFEAAYEYDPESRKTLLLAREVYKAFKFGIPDEEIPLTESGLEQAFDTASKLGSHSSKAARSPQVIVCSNLLRTGQTYRAMCLGRPELGRVTYFSEPLLREQSHGIVSNYPNWKVFLAMHPRERRLKQANEWGYAYPNGESILDLQARIRRYCRQCLPLLSSVRPMLISSLFPITMLRIELTGADLDEFDRINREEKLENAALCVFRRIGNGSSAELLEWNTQLHGQRENCPV